MVEPSKISPGFFGQSVSRRPPPRPVSLPSIGEGVDAEQDPGMDLQAVLERYAEEVRRCRYGSFRGIIKDGKVVVFAIEHEWRPQVDQQRRLDEGEPA